MHKYVFLNSIVFSFFLNYFFFATPLRRHGHGLGAAARGQGLHRGEQPRRVRAQLAGLVLWRRGDGAGHHAQCEWGGECRWREDERKEIEIERERAAVVSLLCVLLFFSPLFSFSSFNYYLTL